MLITGARLLDPRNGAWGAFADIGIDGERIGVSHGPVTNAKGCVAMPGGIDIHAHLFAPSLLRRSSAEGDAAMEAGISAARALLAQGITCWNEPGIMHGQAEQFAAFVRQSGMGASWLALDAPAQKYFGEEGLEEMLAAPETAAVPHLHLSALAQSGGLASIQAGARRLAGRRCHLSHLGSYAFEPGRGRAVPRGQAAAALFDRNPNLSADAGPVVFGPALAFTADAGLAARVAGSAGAVEKHPAMPYQSTPYHFRKDRYIDAAMWLASMEFILSVEDISRLSLSIDHPSGGSVRGYPLIIACLMERDRRAHFMAGLDKEAVAASALPGIRREFSLADIALVTRAAPASALGLEDRGHLGIGARADVVLYREQGDIEKMFAAPHTVMAGGETIIREGQWK